jgi:hypothetical protein
MSAVQSVNESVRSLKSQMMSDPAFRASDSYLGDFPGLSESLVDEGYQPVFIDIEGFTDICEETAEELLVATNTEASMSRTELVIIWHAILLAKVSDVQHRVISRRLNRTQYWNMPRESGIVPGVIARAIESLSAVSVDGMRVYPALVAPAQGGHAPIIPLLANMPVQAAGHIAWSPAAYLAGHALPAGRPPVNFDLPDNGGWTGAASIARNYIRWCGRVKAFYRTWVSGIPGDSITHEVPRAWMMLCDNNDINQPCSVRSVASSATSEYAEAFLYRFLTPMAVEATLYRFTPQHAPFPEVPAAPGVIAVWYDGQNLATLESPYRRLRSAPFVTSRIGGRDQKIGSIIAGEIRIKDLI